MRAAWAIGQTIYSVAALLGAAWSMLAVLSVPQILAIPGAASSPFTLMFAVTVLAAPATLMLSVALGWLGYARHGVKLVVVGPVLVAVNGGLIAAAFFAIQALCDGQFVCAA